NYYYQPQQQAAYQNRLGLQNQRSFGRRGNCKAKNCAKPNKMHCVCHYKNKCMQGLILSAMANKPVSILSLHLLNILMVLILKNVRQCSFVTVTMPVCQVLWVQSAVKNLSLLKMPNFYAAKPINRLNGRCLVL